MVFWAFPRLGYPLNSQLTKTTAEKPCFSKSGDTAAIPNADCGEMKFIFFKE
jgi:hypothetical protein